GMAPPRHSAVTNSDAVRLGRYGPFDANGFVPLGGGLTSPPSVMGGHRVGGGGSPWRPRPAPLRTAPARSIWRRKRGSCAERSETSKANFRPAFPTAMKRPPSAGVNWTARPTAGRPSHRDSPAQHRRPCPIWFFFTSRTPSSHSNTSTPASHGAPRPFEIHSA